MGDGDGDGDVIRWVEGVDTPSELFCATLGELYAMFGEFAFICPN